MANEYVTAAQLKARLGVDAADVIDDAVINAVIESASRAADEWCGRRFFTTVAAEVRYFTPYSSERVLIGDTVSVTTVNTDDAASGAFAETWSSGDWYLGPRNNAVDGLPYRELHRSLSGSRSFNAGYESVKVTGRFGFSTPPKTVVEAVTLLSSRYFKRKDAPLGVAGFNDFGAIRVSEDRDVTDLLSRWRIYAVA